MTTTERKTHLINFGPEIDRARAYLLAGLEFRAYVASLRKPTK
jgi:hypothetical protein